MVSAKLGLLLRWARSLLAEDWATGVKRSAWSSEAPAKLILCNATSTVMSGAKNICFFDKLVF